VLKKWDLVAVQVAFQNGGISKGIINAWRPVIYVVSVRFVGRVCSLPFVIVIRVDLEGVPKYTGISENWITGSPLLGASIPFSDNISRFGQL